MYGCARFLCCVHRSRRLGPWVHVEQHPGERSGKHPLYINAEMMLCITVIQPRPRERMETFADLIVVNAPARNKHVVKEVGVTFADYLVTLLFFYHIMLQKTSAGQNVFEASNLMACSYGCIYEGAEFTTTRYSTESVQIAIEGGCMPVSRSIKDAHPTAYTYPTGPQPSLLKIFTHCYCIIVSSPSTRKSNLHSTAIWCCVWHTRLIRRRIAVGPENLWIRVVLVLSTIIYLILGHTTCAKLRRAHHHICQGMWGPDRFATWTTERDRRSPFLYSILSWTLN